MWASGVYVLRVQLLENALAYARDLPLTMQSLAHARL